ncbi:MAG: FAD-dependent oxidoreductase [Flavobacteriaceae bacterium]
MDSPIKVAVIGAGVSGLVAAIELEQRGFSPIIYESSAHVGGRLASDAYGDFALDHGFQVLLTNYPELKRYALLDPLDLQLFKPGALIFEHQQPHKIGDAFRDLSFLRSTLFSSVATLSDKLTLLKEQKRLARCSAEAIFGQSHEQTTLEYLSERYSDRFIELFFKPFYAGIFLETALKTSYKHFEFVFHHFALGQASLVRKGIQRLPELLASRLSSSELKLGQTFGANQLDDFDAVIQTYAPSIQRQSFNACVNLYFEIEAADAGLLSDLTRTIGLIPQADYVNNLHVLQAGHQRLLSATIVGQTEMSHAELEYAARQELLERCGIAVSKAVKTYVIKRALPAQAPMKASADVRREGKLFFAGDYTLYPSLNAAMQSGRAAAEAVAQTLE